MENGNKITKKIYNKKTKMRQIKCGTLGLIVQITANFALALRSKPITQWLKCT